MLVETLETAASWRELPDLYRAVREALTGALAARGTPPQVLTHVSHVYPTGASLYLTFLALAQRGEELAQWADAKQAASRAILAAGGTITHHHGVGADHRAWYGKEIGPVGVVALQGLKDALDPTGICNPGILLPER